MKVAFVGLGAMGSGMARSILAQGHHVSAFDVYPPSVDKFVAAGGTAAKSPAHAAEKADAIVLMVVNSDQADAALFGEQGAAATLPAGAVVILCSTVPPAYARALQVKLEKHSPPLLYVDAPVSGGVAKAASGALTIMASGSDEAMARAGGVLDAMTGSGGKLYCIPGGAGAGSSVKMVNQLLAGVHIAAAAEAMAIGARAGLNTRALFEVISNAAGSSWMFCNRVPHMLDGDYTPHSALDIFVKDLGIVVGEALGYKFPVPMAAAAHQLFLHGSAMGNGRQDDASVVKCYPGVDVACPAPAPVLTARAPSGAPAAAGAAASEPPRAPKSEVLDALPLVRPLSKREVDAAWEGGRSRCLVVLDDDPTGTQTMHGVRVLLEWEVALLEQAFRAAGQEGSSLPGFFIMTNSRALPPSEARALISAVCKNVQTAAARVGAQYSVVLRSDSTLRGHFPLENDVAEAAMGPFDAWILCPFFLAGGRYTVGDVHYVQEGEELVPAAQTQFAKDQAFGYANSNLRRYVEEKTGGRVPAEKVHSITIPDLRQGGPDSVRDILLGLPRGSVCVVNAAADEDLHVFGLGLMLAEKEGKKRYLCRTAASFVSACLLPGEAPRPPMGPADLVPLRTHTGSARHDSPRGGIVVCGSYVPKTTEQLEVLLDHCAVKGLPLDRIMVSSTLLSSRADVAGRAREIARATAAAEAAVSSGRVALVYTSRVLIRGQDAEDSLAIHSLIASGLVAIVHGVATRPGFLIAKGGITSADMAAKAMRAHSALVAGQASPGVPLWVLDGAECVHPGLPYVVFPGNVGSRDALAHVVERWMPPRARDPPTLSSMLSRAIEGLYAVGAFNVYDLAGGAAVVAAAEAARSPVILQAHPAALKHPAGGAGLAAGLKALAEHASVPVLVHLDHAAESDWREGLKHGFGSLMVDGSHLEFKANAALTRTAVAAAHMRGMGVEAELGRLAGTEDDITVEAYEASLTDPGEAARFVTATGCDALAVCIGNVHGKYPPSGPKIDTARLREIRDAVHKERPGLPLVLHGASGLDEATVKECIRLGCAKFNVNTEVRAAYVAALKSGGYSDLVPGITAGHDAMVKVVREKIELLGSAGKA
ncbi:unnamed protein product [Pedinophyceae sp. YPF-701]|nr:unnamed protein product [Pedinophyceae sp. YPF-701]